MGKKLTIEYINEKFEEARCTLLETVYNGAHTKMKFECYCGDISFITWGHFQQGRTKCKKCGINSTIDKLKHSYEFVYNYFKERNCTLLETKYNNVHTQMKYICECGNICHINFVDFSQGQRCIKCGYKKASDTKTYEYDFVYNYFKEQGCTLLETEYINSQTKMRYICVCGNESTTTWSNFEQGRRCKQCGIEKRSGENNHTWRFDREKYFPIKKQIRRSFSKKWIKNNMQHDLNYNDWLLNPFNYELDHKYPIDRFVVVIIENNLQKNEEILKIKKIANHKDNLQLLLVKENKSKHAKCNEEQFIQYLKHKGITINDR